MKIILCAHLIVWFTKVSASGDNVSHGIIHIGVVITSHQRVIMNLFQDLSIDLEMPIRHWRDGITLRFEFIFELKESLTCKLPRKLCNNLQTKRQPKLVSVSVIQYFQLRNFHPAHLSGI